jgi:hypothetical protein
MAKTDTPAPGSDAALQLGCTCAVTDNAHGYGARGQAGVYWITEDCPLHGHRWDHLAQLERMMQL